jgi:predicted  nucleic acid-binding Zn ribbon protein
MIVANVSFGKAGKKGAAEMESLAEIYIGWLILAGQLGAEYLLAWNKGSLNAYVQIMGPGAVELRYHSDLARLELDRIKQAFGREPVWNILDDGAPKKEAQWKREPFLYLYTHALDWAPPVCRGGNGCYVPTYLLPISDDVKKSLHFWQRSYRQHDDIWLHSGELAASCYMQIAGPQSQLSLRGRELCQAIEKNTGIPTYYYLARFWGRKTGEKSRKCPCCGGNWRQRANRDKRPQFHHFDFQCDRCRLVSHIASSYDNPSLAKIGEYS